MRKECSTNDVVSSVNHQASNSSCDQGLFKNMLSSPTILYTALPQLLCPLLTNDCMAKYLSSHIVKFADDTAMVGLVYHNDGSEDGQEVKGHDCEFSLLPHYTLEELSRWSPTLNTCWCTYDDLTWRISLDILKCVGLGISIFRIEHSYFLHCCSREGTVAGGVSPLAKS